MVLRREALPRGMLKAFITRSGALLSRFEFRGKCRVADSAGKLLSTFCPEAYAIPCPGHKLSVRLNDRAGRMMWAGCYEPELIAILRSILTPGMVVLDVGAHVGFFSVVAAALVGPKGMVCGFEPDPDNLRRIVTNTSGYGWVRLYATAVSDSNGEITFYKSPLNSESGWGTITKTDERRTSIQVAVTSLDEWRKSNGISRIDFVKLDIEGAEHRVLRGASLILQESRPMVFLEINEVCLFRDGKSAKDIIRLLRGYSYWIGYVVNRHDVPQAALAIPEEKKDVCDRIARTVSQVRTAESQDIAAILGVQ